MFSISSFISRRAVACACIALACFVQQAAASVIISGTRVIYPAGDREITVKMDNTGKQPALVQAWIDAGDIKSRPGTVKVPFVLMPPVFRVDPAKGQTVRIVYTGDPLPQDKESVFWLNVLDIPPKVEESTSTTALQLAFRSRIKLFFRPVGLDGDGAVAAAKTIEWSIVPADDGKGRVLRATNPSAFNVTVLNARVEHDGRLFTTKDGAMVAPGGSLTFAFDAPLPDLPAGAKLGYSTINDFGSESKWEAAITPAP
ncbi:fimbria/pilus periplasmic chaperone [Burkholderia sp. SR8]|jgi:chaperone protein EcpD|uniref:fimbrial biogenesis chaperone n=1 Tax=Burkholderia sp. SR8 TaxID=3062277 RepID=UPI00406286BE